MSQEKYIGMDVHQATISVAVMEASGKLIMECLLETKAATMVEFIQGLHGTLSLTFMELTFEILRMTLLSMVGQLGHPTVSAVVRSPSSRHRTRVQSARGRPL